MSRKSYLLGKQLAVATALALGASSVALADDSSMNPFIGDSYSYFNGRNVGDPGRSNRAVFASAPADPMWRKSHPNGLTERDLQALSSSGLSAAAEQVSRPVLASAAADPTWRQSHPNGLPEGDLQALSSSTLAAWQRSKGLENTASAAADPSDRGPGKETVAARMVRIFHPDNGQQPTVQ